MCHDWKLQEQLFLFVDDLVLLSSYESDGSVFLKVSKTSLKQVKFKYFGIVFTSDGRQNKKLDMQTGRARCMNAS